MSKLPPQSWVKYTLAPLVKDGRNCLACRDVEGMEWAILEEVEFYYGGSPWQRIVRKSDDIFALMEKDIFQWPGLERITRARFRVRLQNAHRARQITVRPCLRVSGIEDEADTVLKQWMKKRKFLEEQRGESNLWNSLEVLSTQAALLVEWKEALGDDFEAAQAFLSPTQEQVGSYPCGRPIPCDCRHRVVFESAEDVSAICDCSEEGCEQMLLRPEDLIVYAVNGATLVEAIRKAFAFDACEISNFGEMRARLVGSWGARRSPVFFYVPISGSGTLAEVEKMCATVPNPFILLTPTMRFCTPMVEQAFRRHGSTQMALAGIISLTEPSYLEILPSEKLSVELLLSEFAKRVPQGKALERAVARVEAKLDAIAKMSKATRPDTEGITEDVARQAFELVRKLDDDQTTRRPSLLTVFRLYCMNELSAERIAQHCVCSKATVINRLRVLAEKTGVSPERLRRYSAQFEKMEEDLTDSRATRIYREALTDDIENDEDSEL